MQKAFTKHFRKGFTIVEILVVIVVIAILATIGIISYQGIQQRAENTKTIALVAQWERSIKLVQATNNKLPNDWTCLGQSVNDFPTIGSESIGLGQCERNVIVTNPSPDWTSEFKTVATPGQTQPTYQILAGNASLSQGSLKIQRVSGTNGYIRGIVYSVIYDPAKAPNGQPGAYIFYGLKGQACASGRAYRVINDLNVCAVRLTSDDYANEVVQPI